MSRGWRREWWKGWWRAWSDAYFGVDGLIVAGRPVKAWRKKNHQLQLSGCQTRHGYNESWRMMNWRCRINRSIRPIYSKCEAPSQVILGRTATASLVRRFIFRTWRGEWKLSSGRECTIIMSNLIISLLPLVSTGVYAFSQHQGIYLIYLTAITSLISLYFLISVYAIGVNDQVVLLLYCENRQYSIQSICTVQQIINSTFACG